MKKFFTFMLFALIAGFCNVCEAVIQTEYFEFTTVGWCTRNGQWESVNDGKEIIGDVGVYCPPRIKDAGAISNHTYTDISSIDMVFTTYQGVAEATIDVYVGDDNDGYTKVGTLTNPAEMQLDAHFTIDNPSANAGRVKFLVNNKTEMPLFIRSVSISYDLPRLPAPTLSFKNDYTYPDDQNLVISTDVDGAEINWVIDNDQTQDYYEEAKSVEVPFTNNYYQHEVSAYITKSGYAQSETVTVKFYIKKKLSKTPSFSLEAGSYSSGQTLTITPNYTDSWISYQINDGDLEELYSSTATVELPRVEGEVTTYTVTAFEETGSGVSNQVTRTYVIDNGVLDPPTFSLAPGRYDSAQKVTITANEGAMIKYTLNDVAYLAQSPVEVELPLVDGKSTTYTLSANAIQSGYLDSTSATAVYVISSEYAEKTATLDIAEYAATNSWTDSSEYLTAEVDGITFKVDDENPLAGIYWDGSKSWSAGVGGSLTITVPTGHIIKSIVFTLDGDECFSSADNGELNGNEWATTDEAVSEVTFSSDDTPQVQKIVVEYAYDPVSSTPTVVVDEAVITATNGGIAVRANAATNVTVYTATGQIVNAKRVAAGRTVINLPAGFYVVRAGGTATKVIVR